MRIVFDLEPDRASEITVSLVCKIVFSASQKGLSPTEFVREESKLYEGAERDFVVYTCGRIYAEWDIADRFENLGENPVSVILTVMKLYNIMGECSLEELTKKCKEYFEKGREIEGEKLINKALNEEDS